MRVPAVKSAEVGTTNGTDNVRIADQLMVVIARCIREINIAELAKVVLFLLVTSHLLVVAEALEAIAERAGDLTTCLVLRQPPRLP